LTSSYGTQTAGVTPDNGGRAALKTSVTGPWAAVGKPWSGALYDAGSGCSIGSIYYAWERAGTSFDASDGNWRWWVLTGTTDLMNVGDSTGNLRTGGPGTGTLVAGADRQFAEAALFYEATGAGGADNAEYAVLWTALTVYGDHGLPLIGTDPKGVAASEVIRHLVGKYCPLLNTDAVEQTTYPIPHLVFRDGIDPYDALLEVNKYHLWQLGVYENRTLFFRPVDMTDYDWEVRLSDPGVTVDLQGDSAATLANGITVTYQDVATGRTKILTPDDYPELRDPSDNNPATLAGLDVRTEISLSSPSTADAALQIGRAALAEFNAPKAPGTISVKGHIRDRAGHWQPCWKVRYGDRIIISDHPNDRPRLVVETDYQHDSETVSIAVDSTFKRLDAVLDRLGTALTAANLS
jgi:hypothetical protein